MQGKHDSYFDTGSNNRTDAASGKITRIVT